MVSSGNRKVPSSCASNRSGRAILLRLVLTPMMRDSLIAKVYTSSFLKLFWSILFLCSLRFSRTRTEIFEFCSWEEDSRRWFSSPRRLSMVFHNHGLTVLSQKTSASTTSNTLGEAPDHWAKHRGHCTWLTIQYVVAVNLENQKFFSSFKHWVQTVVGKLVSSFIFPPITMGLSTSQKHCTEYLKWIMKSRKV